MPVTQPAQAMPRAEAQRALCAAISYAPAGDLLTLARDALAAGASLTERDVHGKDVLSLAVHDDRPHAIGTLLALGADLPEVPAHGIDLLIEPINTFDIPGFFISTTAQGVALLDEVGAANAYIQYDVYHMQRMEGELAGTLNRYLARIGHIQIADNPGRNEPGTGEIAYAFLFAHLKRIGWKGAIGCEYKPAAATEAGLGWRQQLAQ